MLKGSWNRLAGWLFVVTFFLALLVPRAFMKGMFLDGVTYASIARNLSEGVGTFWMPHYTNGTYPIFVEQPPLAFFLHSWVYRILGGSYLIDSLWSVFLGALICVLTVLFWKNLQELSSNFETRNEHERQPNCESAMPLWLVPSLLLSFPIIIWTFQNNMLENTMTVFVLASSVCFVGACSLPPSKRVWARMVFAGCAGLFVVFAFLSKGLPALFVYALPPALFLCFKNLNLKHLISIEAVALFVFCLSFLLLFSFPESRAFLEAYFKYQVVKSLAGERELAGSRLSLVFHLGEALLPSLTALCVLSVFQSTRKRILPSTRIQRVGGVALLLALAGSAPLLVSPKQMSWYLVPSLPFYAMALASLFSGNARAFEIWITSRRMVRSIAFPMLAVCFVAVIIVTFVFAGTARRDGDFYSDIESIYDGSDGSDGSERSERSDRPNFVACPSSQVADWGLIAMLQRELKGSIVSNTPSALLKNTAFLVVSDAEAPCPLLSELRCISMQKETPKRYSFWRCTDSAM